MSDFLSFVVCGYCMHRRFEFGNSKILYKIIDTAPFLLSFRHVSIPSATSFLTIALSQSNHLRNYAVFPFIPPSSHAPTQLMTINGPKMYNCGNPSPNSGSTPKLPGYKIALRPVVQYILAKIAAVK